MQEQHTLSIPLIHRVPWSLAAVLHVSDFRESGAGYAEHLLYRLVFSIADPVSLVLGGVVVRVDLRRTGKWC